MSGLDICGSLCDLWKPPPTFSSCKHLSLESTLEVFGPTCVAGKEKGKPILSFCLVVVLLPAMRAIITIDPDSFFPKDVFPAVASQEKSYTQFLLHQYFSNLEILNAIHCIQTVLTCSANKFCNRAIVFRFFGKAWVSPSKAIVQAEF